MSTAGEVRFEVNGAEVSADGSATLLEVLRERLGLTAAKDGCSPQGQCGCCTVLVDGAPRVACVTATRRVAGRSVTTLEGLEPDRLRRLTDAFVACGASQCGFCTPGIVVRLAALEARGRLNEPAAVETALGAHLCRCTGWVTIAEAAAVAAGGREVAHPQRDPVLSAWRATIEGGEPQAVSAAVVVGRGGFADDRAPREAPVAVPAPADRASRAPAAGPPVALGASLAAARQAAGRPPGRRSPVPVAYPVELPAGDFDLTLRTTWVEPAYLEPDASWCHPGGPPASPLANAGAFGAKASSSAPATAAALAEELGRPVRVLWSREDVVRLGPKRPPVAAGVRSDGSGVLRVAWTEGSADPGPFLDAVAEVLPLVEVEVVEVAGPPVSPALRAAGFAEAAVLAAALEAGPGGPPKATVTAPSGGRATVALDEAGDVTVDVWAGEVLDAVTLRSYTLGAVHQALGWVRSEALVLDEEGQPQDLTIRSFGILTARQMPGVTVRLHEADTWPLPASDAVFAATAAAAWLAAGTPPDWPLERRGGR